MIRLDDFDDDATEREQQSAADHRRAVLWCLAMALLIGALIWLAWAGV